MLDAIYITMFTEVPLGTVQGLSGLLNVLESEPNYVPTHWGPDERARSPYDRSEMISVISNYKSNFHTPGLHRRKAPRYEAYFSAKKIGLNYFKLEFASNLKQDILENVFLLGDAIAQQLKPEFGFVHTIWCLDKASQRYSASGTLRLRDFEKFGPKSVYARTWFGSYLSQLIGHESLQKSGAFCEDTAWGGARLDLVHNPWECNSETLDKRQLEVMESLRTTGIFGDYSVPIKPKPGLKWIPISQKTQILSV